ncbi:hypothetical protein [Brevibacterium spongiae]|uniref:Lipoprotein n=1 Tax=Brevibacterium spongiae TaxID=2909672 RepID=A0ABY5SWM4_9MICO|nr:hypothetical protein [Brevibacterium spongiae]UVI37548.1 hypothetical protein L1F31_07835 [Brevibacterium spongiae]
MKNSVIVTATVALAMMLSGCSALKVTSSEEAGSKPAQVGIDDGSSTASATPTQAQIPDGMAETPVELGDECPVDVSLAMGPEWMDESGYDGYRLFSSDTDAIITVNCFEDDESSAKDLIDKARERMFSTSGSTKVSDATGALEGGEYWTVHGRLSGDDMRAVNKQESVFFGVVAGVSVDGTLFKVSVDMLAPADDAKAAEEFRQMLPTVRLDDEELKAPTFT